MELVTANRSRVRDAENPFWIVVSINFIKKPLLSNLLGISQIKKMGKRLVVGDVEILSEDKKQTYAQALFTYSIPGN